ncbi:MAG TPA: hydrogen peroxide-dependent heme synthase [Candidatus Binataceae bacterium]|nr:hydrogen peroxide-dependent heme synthase [Candidatus Binataceae bacterium]
MSEHPENRGRPPAPGADALSHEAPNTLEGWCVLHQMFRVQRGKFGAVDEARRDRILRQAVEAISSMERREDGASALFSTIGHKGDLLALHFRRSLDDLERAQANVAALELSAFLEPAASYVSMVEIGLYEATVALNSRLAAAGVRPHSPEWKRAVEAELASQREKLASRLWPEIPRRRYLSFYPMNKRRAGADNWYQLPIDERRRLMHEHGMIGRRYAGQVTQIISGSIGFDDWEWGVDLFADDPLVFKKLVYEMRFDESSARYAEFGPFIVALRIDAADLGRVVFGHAAAG